MLSRLSLQYWRIKALATLVRTLISSAVFVQRFNPFAIPPDFQRVRYDYDDEYTVPSSISSRKIRVRVWKPKPSATSSPQGDSQRLTPVHLNFHGSGHVIDSFFGSDSDFCQLLVDKLDITVLDCDYAKAPESPYPHGITDAIDVLHYIVANKASEYDIENITVGGFSAGGGLAFGLMTRDNAIAQRHIRAFVGHYPWVDISAKIPFPPELPPGSTSHRLMPFPEQYLFVNAYVQPPFRLDDPNVSPALVSDDGLAQAFQEVDGKRKKQALFLCGDLDNITPQVKTLAARLRSLGINAIYKEFKDCGHSFDKLARKGTWEGARKSEAYAEAVEFLRAVHQVS